MINENNEPLFINLSSPAGTYNITLSLTAHSDCSVTISEETAGFITSIENLSAGSVRDISFTVTTEQNINIKIDCDGDLSATAAAEYTG